MGSKIIIWALNAAGLFHILSAELEGRSEIMVVGSMIIGVIFLCSSAICYVINSKG